nr:hypothetical protein [Tanacetum cinerariifolium]
ATITLYLKVEDPIFKEHQVVLKRATGSSSEGTATKKGRTIAVTTEDIQKRKNDVKARTTLLLALPDEHQLRFSKYKTAQELWAAILKTFGGNEATKKTKKNLLKQQYGNFKAEGSETLEQTFNRLQVIVSQLEFMDLEIEQDDLNQKFLTSLAPEWLMHIIVTQVSPAGSNVATASISLDTACAYIASQSNGLRLNMRTLIRFMKMTLRIWISKAPTEFALMAKTSAESEDMSWTRLPEFADDTITDYSRPSPAIENSTILSKPVIKFVKAVDRPTENKTDKVKTFKKPVVQYDELYRKTSKKSNVRGNQRNWNNAKSQQLGYCESGCSRHMTCNISYLSDYEPFDGGYVSFGQRGCKITGKGIIKIECIVLGQNFKLTDDTNVLLRTPRQHNMYSIDLNNVVPHKDLTCLVAKTSADECMLWHRRLGHLNIKTMN